jgi:hypothetical protein
VTLLRSVGGADDSRACFGFLKRIDDPQFPHFRLVVPGR